MRFVEIRDHSSWEHKRVIQKERKKKKATVVGGPIAVREVSH